MAVSVVTRSTEVWKTQHQLAYDSLAEFQFLYHDWIYPNTGETLRDKDILMPAVVPVSIF